MGQTVLSPFLEHRSESTKISEADRKSSGNEIGTPALTADRILVNPRSKLGCIPR